MSGLPAHVHDLTDCLDAAGNTTAAIGKGFAFGSAALVSLALFGAFCVRAKGTEVDILDPWMFTGLLFGAIMPRRGREVCGQGGQRHGQGMPQAVPQDHAQKHDARLREVHGTRRDSECSWARCSAP